MTKVWRTGLVVAVLVCVVDAVLIGLLEVDELLEVTATDEVDVGVEDVVVVDLVEGEMTKKTPTIIMMMTTIETTIDRTRLIPYFFPFANPELRKILQLLFPTQPHIYVILKSCV